MLSDWICILFISLLQNNEDDDIHFYDLQHLKLDRINLNMFAFYSIIIV